MRTAKTYVILVVNSVLNGLSNLTLSHAWPKFWEILPSGLKQTESLPEFKAKIK